MINNRTASDVALVTDAVTARTLFSVFMSGERK